MPRLTDEQREQILADWSTGHYSQNQLAKNYNVSPSVINKMCKGVEQHNKDLVNTKTTVETQMHAKSEYEVNSIHKAVEERTRLLKLFTDSAEWNQKEANKAAKEVVATEKPKDKLYALQTHANITSKNRDTTLGKEPAVKIDNTNAQQNNTLTLEYTLDEPSTTP